LQHQAHAGWQTVRTQSPWLLPALLLPLVMLLLLVTLLLHTQQHDCLPAPQVVWDSQAQREVLLLQLLLRGLPMRMCWQQGSLLLLLLLLRGCGL
jgi:hypothetical protein